MRVVAAALACLLAGSMAGGCAQLHGLAPDGATDGSPASAASCVAPYIDDPPPRGQFGAPAPTVAPGDVVELHGHWYTSACNDTGEQRPHEPLADVRLTVTLPQGRVVRLGPFTPGGPDMGFTAMVEIPADAAAGTVLVTDDRDPAAAYEFQVRR